MKLDITPTNVIENEGKEWRSITGPKAIEALRLRTILVGLKTEATGMRLTRHVSCTQLAKQLTGLRTRDRAKLAAAVQARLDALLAEVLIINDGV